MSRLLSISRLLDVPVGVAYHVVSALATWLAPLPGGLATAAAIVVFTVAVRLALLPLTYYAIRGEGARARLVPKFQELQKRYAREPDRLRRELSRLRQAEGAGMFAGCLPLLVQLPFLSVMYRLFLSSNVNGSPNTLLTHHLLGVPLASRLLGGAGPVSHQGLVFAGLLALLGVVAWVCVKVAHAPTRPGLGRGARPAGRGAHTAATTAGRGAGPRRTAHARQDDGAGGVVGLLAKLTPYAALVIAAVVPLAAGVYLLTTTAWTVLERTALRRRLLNGGAA